MAISYMLNKLPLNGAENIFNIKTTLKAAGWTILGSSDGFTGVGQNFAIDNISQGATGANGMDNSGAWWWLTSPDSVKQVCAQRGTGGANTCWLRWDNGLGLVGPGSNTIAPVSGVNTANLVGTTAAGTAMAAAGLRVQGGADGVTPYGFWFAGYPSLTVQPECTFLVMYDPCVSGTYRSGDADPYIIAAGYAAGGMLSTLGTGVVVNFNPTPTAQTAAFYAFLGGALSANFLPVAALTYFTKYDVDTGTYSIPGSEGQDLVNGKWDMVPIPYARKGGLATATGYKGMGSIMSYLTVPRITGDTLSLTQPREYIVIGKQYAFKWDETTAPLF